MPNRRDQIAQLLMGQMMQQDQAPVSREEQDRYGDLRSFSGSIPTFPPGSMRPRYVLPDGSIRKTAPPDSKALGDLRDPPQTGLYDEMQPGMPLGRAYVPAMPVPTDFEPGRDIPPRLEPFEE